MLIQNSLPLKGKYWIMLWEDEENGPLTEVEKDRPTGPTTAKMVKGQSAAREKSKFQTRWLICIPDAVSLGRYQCDKP